MEIITNTNMEPQNAIFRESFIRVVMPYKSLPDEILTSAQINKQLERMYDAWQ